MGWHLKVVVIFTRFREKPCSNVLRVFDGCLEMPNCLINEREGLTGEYWPEVVAVRTERREVQIESDTEMAAILADMADSQVPALSPIKS